VKEKGLKSRLSEAGQDDDDRVSTFVHVQCAIGDALQKHCARILLSQDYRNVDWELEPRTSCHTEPVWRYFVAELVEFNAQVVLCTSSAGNRLLGELAHQHSARAPETLGILGQRRQGALGWLRTGC
jgi:hypothetical protein